MPFNRRPARSLSATCLLVILAASGPLASGHTPPEGEAALAGADGIAQWVDQLDDDQYAARQWAQQRLQQAGAKAVDAVAQAADSESPEASSRAVNVLIAWSESDDPALRILALERLARLYRRPTEAALAQDALADVRQVAAIEQIVAHQGEVLADRRWLAARPHDMPLQIVIGPEWTGGVDGLAALADVKDARVLSFHSAPIDDAAVPKLLTLEHIERLEFYGTPLTQESLDQLNASLPKLRGEVDYRGGAQLGVTGSPMQAGPQGAIVNAVHPGSAADRAGMKSRDLVVEIDGEAVADFSDLTGKISKYQAGDRAQVQVLRQGQPVMLTVEFDRWGEAEHPGSQMTPVPIGRKRKTPLPAGPAPMDVRTR